MHWYKFHREIVRLGAHDHTIPADGINIRDIEINDTYIHENFDTLYSESAATETAVNDIAILKLAQDVVFTSELNDNSDVICKRSENCTSYYNTVNIQPICLPYDKRIRGILRDPSGSPVSAGWGHFGTYAEQAEILQQLTVTLQPGWKCAKFYGDETFNNSQQICVGNPKRTEHNCLGDSGRNLILSTLQFMR